MTALPEIRFGPGTERCPHPERWTSTDGDSTEIEVQDLAWGLVRALQPNYCLETGSGLGQTSKRIGEALQANGQGKLYAVDVDQSCVIATANAVSGLPVEVCGRSSLEFFLPCKLIEFAWLDSWYEHRANEFLRFLPKMRSGTIVCFHDTAPEHGAHRIPSGRDLRSEIEHKLGSLVRVVHLPTPRGVTIAEVL